MPAFEINLNTILNWVLELGALPPDEFLVKLLVYFGWIPIFFVLLYGAREIYVYQMKSRYSGAQQKILLAIDIPKDNEQTPTAVENILSQLAGGHSPTWWFDVYKSGEFQQVISLEIVSIEGHIQFLIHINAKMRDLVEAAIFAQYPQARITEVADFTSGFPTRYPDDEYDMWGTEFVYVKNNMYPIRMYRAFGDPLNQEYKDPMAGMLEVMSRMGKGEHLWYQIIIRPIYQTWTQGGKDEINKILGKKKPPTKTPLDAVTDVPLSLIRESGNLVFGTENEAKSAPDTAGRKITELAPGEVNQLNLIDQKCSKIGFETKIRLVYIAKHEVFSKAKVAGAMVGAIKQYNTEDGNALKPDYKVVGIGGDYFFKWRKNAALNSRKMDLMMGYSKRGIGVGTVPIIMNVEELASLWHFPLFSVKAPLVKKIEMKTAEPPANLPGMGQEDIMTQPHLADIPETPKEDTVEGDGIDFYTDYFEDKFAIGPSKTGQQYAQERNQQVPAAPAQQKDDSWNNLFDESTSESALDIEVPKPPQK